jgi:hypothetical protein
MYRAGEAAAFALGVPHKRRAHRRGLSKSTKRSWLRPNPTSTGTIQMFERATNEFPDIRLPNQARRKLPPEEGDYLEAEIVGTSIVLTPKALVDREAARQQVFDAMNSVEYVGPKPEPSGGRDDGDDRRRDPRDAPRECLKEPFSIARRSSAPSSRPRVLPVSSCVPPIC